MVLFIAAVCFAAAGFIGWKIHKFDRDPNVPGPVSHVILPAAALPVIGLLLIMGLLALAYSYGWLRWLD